MPAVSRPKQIRLGIDELSWLHLTAWGAESRYPRRGKALPTYYYHVLRWLRTRLLHPMSHCLNLADAGSQKKVKWNLCSCRVENYSMVWKSMRSWDPVLERRQGLANVKHCLHLWWPSMVGCPVALIDMQPNEVIWDVNIRSDLKWKK